MHHLGTHLLIELYDCARDLLDDPPGVESLMLLAAKEAGATVVSSHCNRFEPHGVSGVVILAESHLTIHTWPEHGYAAVDLFSCGSQVQPWLAKRSLERSLGAQRSSAMELRRGLFEQALASKPSSGASPSSPPGDR